MGGTTNEDASSHDLRSPILCLFPASLGHGPESRPEAPRRRVISHGTWGVGGSAQGEGGGGLALGLLGQAETGVLVGILAVLGFHLVLALQDEVVEGPLGGGGGIARGVCLVLLLDLGGLGGLAASAAWSLTKV